MVRIGDVAVIAGEPVELSNDRVVSRSMDNRLGCYVALEAARIVAEAGGAPGDVFAVAAVQEETEFGGSAPSPTRCAPTSRSSSTSRTRPTRRGGGQGARRHAFGSGPVIERGTTSTRA